MAGTGVFDPFGMDMGTPSAAARAVRGRPDHPFLPSLFPTMPNSPARGGERHWKIAGQPPVTPLKHPALTRSIR
ncbi:hypothetical protein SGPA1_20964 [Streptomyces misionensis JCM 4497]